MNFQNILIIDDSGTSRMIIHRCFEIIGYSEANYTFADNGITAIKKIKDNQAIDLIVLDLNMPKMNGKDFINTLVKEDLLNNISIIIISSVSNSIDEDTKTELIKNNVVGFVQKPVNPAKLSDVFGEIND